MIDTTEHLDPRAFSQPVDVVLRHVQRYLDAVNLLGRTGENETWLDFGCGEGYGASLLRNFATNVVGYDPNIREQRNPRTDIPLFSVVPDMRFDVVFCIEVIEHVNRFQAPGMVDHLKLLGRNVIISTPICPEPNYKPVNPHHQHEYSLDEFVQMVEDAGLSVERYTLGSVTLTDGETKEQGIFLL